MSANKQSANRTPDKNGPVARALTILRLLAPHALDGLTNKEIISNTGYAAHTVCRDLADLKELGEVEKRDERWYPHPRSVGIYRAYKRAVDNFASRATDFDARVEAQAKQLQQ